ncbi:MAG: hypothetical protein NTV29_09645 [Planctomycetota bacterium]|nr:hypothetical protein [Planctomycetota bacterium]
MACTWGANKNQSWNLTSVGDWTSVTTNGIAQNRTHGPTHELLTAGGSSVTTDVKGNITSLPTTLRPAGATTALLLTWDFDNQLASADINTIRLIRPNTSFIRGCCGSRIQ